MIVHKAPRSRPVCLLTFYVLSIYLLCPEGLWNFLQNSQESVIFSNSYSEEHHWTVAFQLIVVTQSQQWKHQSCEICSKLTTKTPQRRHWHCSGVFMLTINWFHALLWCFHFWLWKSKYPINRWHVILTTITESISFNFYYFSQFIWFLKMFQNIQEDWLLWRQ